MGLLLRSQLWTGCRGASCGRPCARIEGGGRRLCGGSVLRVACLQNVSCGITRWLPCDEWSALFGVSICSGGVCASREFLFSLCVVVL